MVGKMIETIRIWCQKPYRSPQPKSTDELLQRDLDLVKRTDTETAIRDAPTGFQEVDLLSYLGLRQINEREILKSMLEAEEKGFDAVVGLCFFDSAVRAARSLMDIPVVGAAEASMHLARMMGNHFAVITSDPRFIPIIENHMEELGTRPFAVSYRPVRHLTQGKSFFELRRSGDYGAIMEDFTRVAQGCIEDGAEVLIPGSGALSPILSVNGVRDIEGAPIIDPVQVSLKFAEMMVDFRASGMPVKSSRGLFLKAPKEDIFEGYKLL